MPRPASLSHSMNSPHHRDGGESIAAESLSRTPTMKKAKARLSRLLRRKSFEAQDFSSMYEGKEARNYGKNSIKSFQRRTIIATQPIGGGTRDIRWHPVEQAPPEHFEHDPHKLSMVSERDEPLSPGLLARPASTSAASHKCRNCRPSTLELYGYRPDSRPGSSVKSCFINKGIAGSSCKHDSMFTDSSELCAMPNDEDDEHRDQLRQIHELPSSRSMTRLGHGRTPSCSAPIPCTSVFGDGVAEATEEDEEKVQEEEEDNDDNDDNDVDDEVDYSDTGSEYDAVLQEAERIPVSPIAPPSPNASAAAAAAAIPQVTAVDVQRMPDFSFVPNTISTRGTTNNTNMNNRHLSPMSNSSISAAMADYDNTSTDWQVECYRLRKQLKAVELQLRYKAELLLSEQSRVAAVEAEVERTKTELQLCRGETQLLRVSNGLKHDETCALKAELGSLQSSDQNRNKDLVAKLRVMTERLALEEDAVADKDLRIKWLEKEREELERENRLLENVKGALWGHMEQARKREVGAGSTAADPPHSPPATAATATAAAAAAAAVAVVVSSPVSDREHPAWWI